MAGRRERSRGRRSNRLQIRAVLTLALALLFAGFWWWFGDRLRDDLGLAGSPMPARDDALRVVSWNLENFTGDPTSHDLDRLREVIAELDPDVIALQEIKDPRALAELLPEFELLASNGGGRGDQKVAIAWRPDRVVRIAGPIEHSELSLGGRVRPGLSAYLRGREGPDLWLVVVHLKAMSDGIDQRREQWRELVAIADAAQQRSLGPDAADLDLLIVGDFNSTGPGDGTWSDEQRELANALAPARLRRIPSHDGCTAYYDGRRRDAWKEPSEIDLMWVRGLDESLDGATRLVVGTHCARRSCQPFRSTDAYPEPDYERLSDHCPVVLDLTRADDD
jgi:endonuclease/exonuclease/phosphatase family metal-dependent hydrolase